MKKIFFWAPFNSNIGTIKSVINSIKSIKKYSGETINPVLVDATNEWKIYNDICEIIHLRKNKFDFRNIKNKGFFWSRLFYLNIFVSCFFKLDNEIKKHKPDYLIAHLVSSLPIMLFLLFSYNTKLILRISGEPKLGFFRKLYWKLISKKIYAITCPSTETRHKLIDIFEKKKIHVLFDPVIEIQKINFNKKIKLKSKFLGMDYILAVGRLTKQKNFQFLIKNFKRLKLKYPKLNLIILGEGEEKNYIEGIIKKLSLTESVFLQGFENNVFNYLNNAKCLVMTSLYENPGHVLIEAAASNCPIISSDCPTGPREILMNGEAGYLFGVDNSEEFIKNFENFLNLKNKKIMLLNAKKKSMNYTLPRHYFNLHNIIY